MIEGEDVKIKDDNLPENAATIGVPEENAQKVVRDYQEEIYSDVPGTIVREVVSNAVDAHRMLPEDLPSIPEGLGTEFDLPTDKPVTVRLVDGSLLGDGDATLEITDRGPGMSEDYVLGPFSEYRSSGKNHTNRYIGGYGIGAKCPLGYRDSFLLDSCWNGMMTTYVLHRHQDGDKIFPVQKQEYEERPFGTRVRVPIERSDTEDFKDACAEQLYFLADQIEFRGSVRDFSSPEYVAEGEHFSLLPKNHLHCPGESGYSSRIDRGPFVSLGGILYSLDDSEFDIDIDGHLVLKMDPGAVELTLSREQIKYSDDTIQAVREHLQENIVPELKDYITQTDPQESLTPLQRKLFESAVYSAGRRVSNSSEADAMDEESMTAALAARVCWKATSDNQVTVAGIQINKGPGPTTRRVQRVSFPGRLRKVSAQYNCGQGYSFKNTYVNASKVASIMENPEKVFWTTGSSDAPTNRYLRDTVGNFWFWEISDEDDPVLNDIRDRFRSYDDLEFEREEYENSGGGSSEDEIPAYEIALNGKWQENREKEEYLRETDEVLMYGRASDKEELYLHRVLSHFLPERTDHGRCVRVSRSNVAIMKESGHIDVREFDHTDELLTKLGRAYRTYVFAIDHNWMRNFSELDELEAIGKVWYTIRDAIDGLYGHPVRSFRQYWDRNSDGHIDLSRELMHIPAQVARNHEDDTRYLQCVQDEIEQIKQLNSKLEAVYDTVSNIESQSDDSVNSLIHLAKPVVEEEFE